MNIHFYSSTIVIAYSLGVIFAILALWRSRTPQGAAAWVMALISMPFIAIPAFLVFGRNRYNKYRKRRRVFDKKIQDIVSLIEQTVRLETRTTESTRAFISIAHTLRQPSFTSQNSIDLLIDGDETYSRMRSEIEKAEKYILFQFYIFRDDVIGQIFRDLLIKKSKMGVQVYFLYDGLGTRISNKFLKPMRESGIKVCAFKSSKAVDARIQLNFRNHRKVIIIDGVTSFIGGLNIGDDYLGKYPKIGPWRDTHVVISGPATISAQISFLKDWNWANHEILNLDWTPTPQKEDSEVLVLHTSPADEIEAALLAHLSLVNSAKSRIWISNPYFVPSEGLINALILACQRGVEVKVIVPLKNDNIFVNKASQEYLERLIRQGAKIYRYAAGFTHQKVMLIDNEFGVVGSTNFDARSLFINFEIQVIARDVHFIGKMNHMFINDFNRSQEVFIREFNRQSLFDQFLIRAANLISPML